MKNRQSFLAFYIGIAVFLADFISKYLVQEYIPRIGQYINWYPYGGYGVFKNFFGIEFSINHHINRGAAWGILADWQQELIYLRLFLVIGLVFYVLFVNKRKEFQIPFALIIAGAAGNVVDYYLYGHVIDMLHFNFWGYDYPVFNIADSAIFIGITWLLIRTWCDKPLKVKQ